MEFFAVEQLSAENAMTIFHSIEIGEKAGGQNQRGSCQRRYAFRARVIFHPLGRCLRSKMRNSPFLIALRGPFQALTIDE